MADLLLCMQCVMIPGAHIKKTVPAVSGPYLIVCDLLGNAQELTSILVCLTHARKGRCLGMSSIQFSRMGSDKGAVQHGRHTEAYSMMQ